MKAEIEVINDLLPYSFRLHKVIPDALERYLAAIQNENERRFLVFIISHVSNPQTNGEHSTHRADWGEKFCEMVVISGGVLRISDDFLVINRSHLQVMVIEDFQQQIWT